MDFETHVIGELKTIKDQVKSTNGQVANNSMEIGKVKVKVGIYAIVVPLLVGGFASLLTYLIK